MQAEFQPFRNKGSASYLQLNKYDQYKSKGNIG